MLIRENFFFFVLIKNSHEYVYLANPKHTSDMMNWTQRKNKQKWNATILSKQHKGKHVLLFILQNSIQRNKARISPIFIFTETNQELTSYLLLPHASGRIDQRKNPKRPKPTMLQHTTHYSIPIHPEPYKQRQEDNPDASRANWWTPISRTGGSAPIAKTKKRRNANARGGGGGGGSRGSGGGQWSQTWLSPQEVEDRVGGGHGCRRTWAAAAGALPPPLPDDATATPCPSRARKKPTPAFLESGRRQSGSRRWGRALASLSCSLALPGRETSNSKSLGFLVEDEKEKGEGFVRRRRGGGFASCEANKYALGCSMWAYFGWAKGPNPRENTTVHFFHYWK